MVPWDDVERCIKQIKADRLGDVVGLFGIDEKGCTNRPQYLQDVASLCRKERLYFHTGECNYPANEIKKMNEIAGELFLGQEEGEFTSSRKRKRMGQVGNMKEGKEKLIAIMRERYAEVKKAGGPTIFNVEGGPIGHGESLEAGADICFSEHFRNIALQMSSARGTTKAYEKPLWGAWLNVEFYAKGGEGYGPPQDDSYTPAHQRRLMLDYNMSYIYGADLIFLQDCLFKIAIANVSPRKAIPLPPVYDAESPQCKGFREVAKRFYNYVQTHPRSNQEPAVDIGLVWGNLEGIGFFVGTRNSMPTRPIWMQTGDAWKASIEAGWERIYDIISLGQPSHDDISRYAGTPYGQIDIVPVRAPMNVLQKYKVLIFLGWNTMTPEIYAQLREYVHNGGHLFMSLPQLSQQIERKPELELINNGDFRDLFGVSVTGKREGKADEKISNLVKFVDGKSSDDFYEFSAEGEFEYPAVAKFADLKMGRARILAAVKNSDIPVLTENKLGQGSAYLLNYYSFTPVGIDFIKPILKGITKTAAVELLGDHGEKKDINYAVYPGQDENKETKIFLVNIDWTTAENVKKIKIRIKDMELPVEIKEGAIKIINVLGGLALTTCNESAYLSLQRFVKNTYTAELSGQRECILEGYMQEKPRQITLGGKDVPFDYDPATHVLKFKCDLSGKQVLEVYKN